MKEVIGKLNEGLKDEDYKRSSINANHRIKNIKRFSKNKTIREMKTFLRTVLILSLILSLMISLAILTKYKYRIGYDHECDTVHQVI